jgi:hypothetical protein
MNTVAVALESADTLSEDNVADTAPYCMSRQCSLTDAPQELVSSSIQRWGR